MGVRLRALTSKMVLPLKTTWGDPYSKWFIAYWGQGLDVQKEFGFSLVIMQSETADGSLRSLTGGVEESHPTPHIHEQMTAYIMATTTSTLSQTR